MRRLHGLCVVILATAVFAGCGSDGDPEDTAPSPGVEDTTTTDAPTTSDAGPIAGSGAKVRPGDTKAWCGAITAEQLSALTGFEVVDVATYGDGVDTCNADLPGVELEISWGSKPTKKSFKQYEASWSKPAGVYETSDITLAGDQPAVVATLMVPAAAFAGTVINGRLVQATVSAVVDDESAPADLAEMAEQILAVYAA